MWRWAAVAATLLCYGFASIVGVVTSFTPMNMVASEGALAPPASMTIPAPPFLLGSLLVVTFRFPVSESAFARSSTNCCSPCMCTPSDTRPNVCTDIMPLSSTINPALLKQSISCFPSSALSTSRAYDSNLIRLPASGISTGIRAFICLRSSRLGWICFSRARFAALNSSADLSNSAIRSWDLPRSRLASAVSFSSVPVLHSEWRSRIVSAWYCRYAKATVMQAATAATMPENTNPLPAKSYHQLAQSNVAWSKGISAPSDRWFFWAILIVLAAPMAMIGTIAYFYFEFRRRTKRLEGPKTSHREHQDTATRMPQ